MRKKSSLKDESKIFIVMIMRREFKKRLKYAYIKYKISVQIN